MAESNPKTRVEPQDLLLSVATVPLVAGLVAGRAIAELIFSISEASEEVFRGDRLPVLNLNHPPDEAQKPEDSV